MTIHNSNRGGGGRGAGMTAGVFGRFASAFRRRREIARHDRHLRSLPDHMLKDIGLHRSEISAVARFGRIEYGG